MITQEDIDTVVKELSEEHERAMDAIDDQMEVYLATLRKDDLARAERDYDEMVAICELESADALRIFKREVPAGSEDSRLLEFHMEKLRSSLELSRNVLSSLVALRVK